jgi:hypothetical protein
MTHHLIVAAIIVGLLYIYNGYSGTEMPLWQYALVFVIVAIVANMVMKGSMTQTTYDSYSDSSLVNKIESFPATVMNMITGTPDTPKCYNVPFKVLSTQYGDKALLAGYNEMVQPYQTGASGLYEPPYRGAGSAACDQIGYTTESV